MTFSTQSEHWCELAAYWISRHGVDDLDALQRGRFGRHASQCSKCGIYLSQLSQHKPSLNEGAETAHLADATILAVANGTLSADEHELVSREVGPHLEDCDLCAGRLATATEWPELADSREIVVGRAPSARFRWDGGHADFAWRMDQPGIGLSLWRVSLRFMEGDVEATVSTEGEGIPGQWRLSLPFSTSERLLPTLILSSETRTAQCHTDTSVLDEWMITPILTASLPAWSRLVAGGEDPATMVWLEDTRPLEIALVVPYTGPQTFDAIRPWLNELLVDLRGERLHCVEKNSRERELTGAVLDRKSRELGEWTVRFSQDRMIDLVVKPIHDEILRVATAIDEEPLLVPQPQGTKVPMQPIREEERMSAEISQVARKRPLETGKEFLNQVVQNLKSRMLPLLTLPRVVLEPAVPVLGKRSHEADIRSVSVSDALGVDANELQRMLPWCKPTIEIVRTYTEEEGKPIYSAFAAERKQQDGARAEQCGSIVITLVGKAGERCTACLNSANKEAIFEGDRLPVDLESIEVELEIREE